MNEFVFFQMIRHLMHLLQGYIRFLSL